ncbi:Co2+/Mg2+ efflux protein ApaG [uncultured Sneathiella sp.]|jgi:ApaG protein|uniref:Co2+/Mg2+ efflux protein ApaG n=1 Tax=uncultured Sneathiella sp. TaxID=879315 RepID=UPI0030DD9D59|tara:strand:- start:100 stop:507 length:408 start_codon:yes stop_codon:yes gene_type:complete
MMGGAAYSKITENIMVSVTPVYLTERSRPADGLYVWAYQVRIENQGSRSVTLRNRHWRITNADGHTETVDGEGVIGEQPVLAPGDVYEYTSGTPLSTSSGIMVGSYDMESEEGKIFAVDIPAFSLDSPDSMSSVH